MLTFFSDTDCDITPKECAEYGIKMISMPYTVGNQVIYPYIDFDEFDYHKFYDMLRSGTMPTTSAMSEEAYIQYFEPEFAAGNDIIYVHFSSATSNTFTIMNQAVEKLKQKYPGRKFYEIDTLGITALSYNVVLEAAELYKAGRNAEEIVEWSKVEVPKFPMYFFADDLKFFRRSGRVSGLAATMGGFIGIRPIIYLDNQGNMVSIGKETGRAKAIARLVKYVEDLGEDVKAHRVVIGHSDCLDIAAEAERQLKEIFDQDLNVITVAVNPTIGSHCGPNAIGICFHAKHR
ncbi:MAG: DegV family protein [Bacteroidales bacterium]|nr:DegV family protein [Bacteroidales bacterium]